LSTIRSGPFPGCPSLVGQRSLSVPSRRALYKNVCTKYTKPYYLILKFICLRDISLPCKSICATHCAIPHKLTEANTISYRGILKEKRNSKPHGTTDISRLVVEKTSDILSPARITPRKCEFLFTNRKSKRHSEFPAVSGAHPTQKKKQDPDANRIPRRHQLVYESESAVAEEDTIRKIWTDLKAKASSIT
jgi:hypothetical protein